METSTKNAPTFSELQDKNKYIIVPILDDETAEKLIDKYVLINYSFDNYKTVCKKIKGYEKSWIYFSSKGSRKIERLIRPGNSSSFYLPKSVADTLNIVGIERQILVYDPNSEDAFSFSDFSEIEKLFE